ncbi:hypothetical protein K8R32_04520 [bacterium]|nr:hypothetical protein [bacterium]
MKKNKENIKQPGKIITEYRGEKETPGKRHAEFFVFIFFSLIAFLFLAFLFFYINVNLYKHKISDKSRVNTVVPQDNKTTKPPSLFID